MRNISLKSIYARLSVTLLLLMGSMSTSAQYYLNVYEKTGSNNQYEIGNLDSVSIVKYDVANVLRLTINHSRLNLETGEHAQLSVRGFASNGTEIPLTGVIWKSDDTAVATVDSKGAVRTYKSGNTSITASIGSISVACSLTVIDHTYTLADLSRIIIIESSVNIESIASDIDSMAMVISERSVNIETGDSTKLVAIGYTSNGTEISLQNILWKSSNTTIATVDENGAVKTHNSGIATITASFGLISHSRKISVVDHTYTLSDVVKIDLDKKELDITTGDSDSLAVKGYASNGVEIPLTGVVWKSTNPSVAFVDENGTVTAMAKGNATITACLNNKSESCAVTVKDKFVAIDVAIDSLAESGVYMGVMSFNSQLYTKEISLLNSSSKSAFNNFIDGMNMKNGTLLCYAVDNAIDSLGSEPIPSNVTKVAIVTFTDGLDLGSNDMIQYVTGVEYEGDEYLEAIKKKMLTHSLAGVPITAYSVGLKGSDVKDVASFRSTLKQLASSDENAIEVENMSEVKAKFKEIAEQLNGSINYQTVPIIMIGLSKTSRVRFTLDNVSDASLSNIYIEGTYDRSKHTLVDVEYHGLVSSSGTVVPAEVTDVIYNTFTFENVLTNDNSFINKNFIGEWYLTSDGLWQPTSEVDPDQTPDIKLTQSSIVIMLVLDCSSSLGEDFSTVKENAKDFINTMYSAVEDGESNESGLNDNYSLYSKTPIDLSLAVSIDGVRYYLTQEQYKKANLSKATIEGVTVILNDEQFIIALQNEPIAGITQTDAKSFYSSNLPTQSQGKVVSARWSYINEAIKAFGGDALSNYFWTNYTNSSNYYAVYSGAGNLYSTSSSSKYPVRLVKSTTVSSPIKWRDENDLKLVAFKESEQFLYSSSQWNNIANKSDYNVLGILVTIGNNKFVISLHNEAIDNVIQSYARTTYGSNLPTQNQGKIISARWSYINEAITSFGGDALSNYFWTGYYSGSNYYAVYSGGGALSSASSSSKYPVRLVYPVINSIKLSDTTLSLNEGVACSLMATLMADNSVVSGSVTWTSNNPLVATVDNEGKVTGISIGTATITASSQYVSSYCLVTVNAPYSEDNAPYSKTELISKGFRFEDHPMTQIDGVDGVASIQAFIGGESANDQYAYTAEKLNKSTYISGKNIDGKLNGLVILYANGTENSLPKTYLGYICDGEVAYPLLDFYEYAGNRGMCIQENHCSYGEYFTSWNGYSNNPLFLELKKVYGDVIGTSEFFTNSHNKVFDIEELNNYFDSFMKSEKTISTTAWEDE